MADLYDLSDRELQLARLEIERRQKSAVVAWLLWLFLGGLGGHRYYLGPVWQGILMTLTLGGLGFWALIDAFFIPRRLRAVNQAVEDEVVRAIIARRGQGDNPASIHPA
ncbi:TM2 domain-containing protein [Thermaerobacter litoralis]